MADDVLVHDPHGAVQLHGLLADEAHRLSDIGLGAGHGAAARGNITVAGVHGGNDRHGAGLLRGDVHIRHAMLQRLEGADGDAELLAGFQIIQGRLIERGRDSQSLGAQRGNTQVHRALQDVERLVRPADQLIAVHGDVLQLQVGGSAAGMSGVREQGQARGIAPNEEQRYARRIGHIAAAARRHEKPVRRRGIEHHCLAASQTPAVAASDSAACNMRQRITSRRLVGGEGDLQPPRGNLRQHGLLDGVASGIAYQSAAQHHGAQVRLQQQSPADQLHHRHDIHAAAAETAEFCRKGQGEQTELGELLPRFG